MKIAATFLALTSLVLAQAPPPPVRPALQSPNPAPIPANPPAREPEAVLDLDFPGGSPSELVAAMSKSLGKQINVIINADDDTVRLPPVRVREATVSGIFAAITSATTREELVAGGMGNLQYVPVSSRFLDVTKATKESGPMWAFTTNEVSVRRRQESDKTNAPELRHFQLKFYLSDTLKVEDITTAIRTGWDMLGIRKDLQPALKFHEETGILLAVGNSAYLAQIPVLLEQLPTGNGSGATIPRPAPPQVPNFNQPPVLKR